MVRKSNTISHVLVTRRHSLSVDKGPVVRMFLFLMQRLPLYQSAYCLHVIASTCTGLALIMSARVSMRLCCRCVYGGAPKGPQLRDIRDGCAIVIATPGRLNDFLEGNMIRLEQVSYLVLDEADRMLDMGFEPQIQRICSRLPQQRQTLFFSATWPKEVKNIASQFVRNHPVHVFVGGVEEKLVANKVRPLAVIVSPTDKVILGANVCQCGASTDGLLQQ